MRVLGKVLSAAAVAMLAPVTMPACAANDQTIYIRQVQAPPQGCTYTADPTAPRLFEGALDLGVKDTYQAKILVGSQLQVRGDSASARAESNRGHLNGAVVTVTGTNGALLGEFTTVGNGFVDPQVGNSGSFGLLDVTLIDAATADKIRPSLANLQPGASIKVIATVRAFGKTLGGIDLESGDFQFPISVCHGCLISFRTGDDPAIPELDCNLPLDTTSTSDVEGINACDPGQDGLIPCQLCQRLRPACRGEGL